MKKDGFCLILRLNYRSVMMVYDICPEEILTDSLNANSDRINELNKILKNKNYDDIRNDYNIFKEMNNICFDKSRTYIIAEKNILLDNAKKDLHNILEKLHLNSLKSFVDIGCGYGQYPRASYELGVQKNIGIDIKSNKMWDDYTIKGKCDYLKINICELAKYERFSLVTSFNAFEHFLEPELMLEAMSRFVEDFLYIRFYPIWNDTDGHHMYRKIHVPWWHLIFSDTVVKEYCEKNNIELNKNIFSQKTVDFNTNMFNKWHAINYFIMFTKFNKLKLKNIDTHFSHRHIWFLHKFRNVLPKISNEELLLEGFEVIYQREKISNHKSSIFDLHKVIDRITSQFNRH